VADLAVRGHGEGDFIVNYDGQPEQLARDILRRNPRQRTRRPRPRGRQGAVNAVAENCRDLATCGADSTRVIVTKPSHDIGAAVWLEDYRARPPAGQLPAGLRPLSQVSALKRSPRALGVPYRGRMGKRDALACLAFRLTADVRRATPMALACWLPIANPSRVPALVTWLLAPTTPAGQATQTIAGAALATASTVGLFSG
jgi:hypothetical protein